MRHGNFYIIPQQRQILLIPILPMRHGNHRVSLHNSHASPIPILPMRHGNSSVNGWSKIARRIPILPMRHGNYSIRLNIRSFSIFRSYLWGMETNVEFVGINRRAGFRSYLWGMETLMDNLSYPSSVRIPILPMRHGNNEGCILMDIRGIFRSYLWGMETSGAPQIEAPPKIGFRSYLWGMETGSHSLL